jgi:hypothetical protein
MKAKWTIALIVGLALVGTAGMAAATYQGRSIWGTSNPGQGGDHAAMPDAAAEHNRAGVNHPFPEHPETPGGEGDEGNEESEGAGSQPDDVPPAHAHDGEPEDGQPDDVPPAHANEHAHDAQPAA